MKTKSPAVALVIALSFGGVGVSVTAATPEPTAARSDARVLSLDIAGGRWSFVGRGVSIKEVAKEVAAKAPVDIRIQDPSLEDVKVGIAFQSIAGKDAIAQVLHGFNYAQFDDPKTGRQVYLVTSLATEVKPVQNDAKPVAVATAPATAPAKSGSASRARSLDELRPVQPAQIKSREQSQAEIDADFKREREEKLARAIDALRNKDVSAQVQQQALAELAQSNDPRATAALREAWQQVQGMPNVNAQVAQSVWRNAAQQQFTNNDANALLLSLGNSPNPQVQEVARQAKADMDRYRAVQNKP